MKPEHLTGNESPLDPCEMIIRDDLSLSITNWRRFRHTIRVGTDSSHLRSVSSPLIHEVRESYLSLGKSHYEVITSLGCAKICVLTAEQTNIDMLLFRHLQKSFYFHLGCLLDNLARLVFIINDPAAATRVYKKGSRSAHPVRNWIDWGELQREIAQASSHYRGYRWFAKSRPLKGITNVRNGFAHGWSPPFVADPKLHALGWPLAIRTARNFYWPHDERESALMRRHYRRYRPILDIMREDFAFMESLQDRVFARLTRDVKKFEKNNGIVIR